MQKMTDKACFTLKWASMSIAAVAICCSTGCQSTASISWDKPGQSKPLNKTVYVKKAKYDDNNSIVGKHTFTLFAIPIMSIDADQPVDECVTKAVRDVYARAGYNVVDSADAPANSAIVTPKVTKFHYWSYSWLWPLFLTGGDIQMDVAVESKSGQALWQKSYMTSSSRMTFFACFGFDGAIKEDMTQIVNKMATDAKGNSEKIIEQQASTATAVPSP